MYYKYAPLSLSLVLFIGLGLFGNAYANTWHKKLKAFFSKLFSKECVYSEKDKEKITYLTSTLEEKKIKKKIKQNVMREIISIRENEGNKEIKEIKENKIKEEDKGKELNKLKEEMEKDDTQILLERIDSIDEKIESKKNELSREENKKIYKGEKKNPLKVLGLLDEGYDNVKKKLFDAQGNYSDYSKEKLKNGDKDTRDALIAVQMLFYPSLLKWNTKMFDTIDVTNPQKIKTFDARILYSPHAYQPWMRDTLGTFSARFIESMYKKVKTNVSGKRYVLDEGYGLKTSHVGNSENVKNYIIKGANPQKIKTFGARILHSPHAYQPWMRDTLVTLSARFIESMYKQVKTNESGKRYVLKEGYGLKTSHVGNNEKVFDYIINGREKHNEHL